MSCSEGTLINKAGTARAAGKFLMLTMTYNLVQRSNPFSHSYGGKFICVLHWGAEAVSPRRVGSRQAGHRASVCWQLSPRADSRQAGHRARAVLSGASWSVQSSGPPHLHRRGCHINSTGHFLLTEPKHLVNLCFNFCEVQRKVPSKALLIHCSADSR